jgi:CrcB protein
VREVVFLAIAGALGTLSRYGLCGLTQKLTGAGFPYGTLLVNVLGCLIIGFIMQIGLNTDFMSKSLRLAITLGFLGAFTTFSTFSYETVTYIQNGAWLHAAANIAMNLVLCIIATLLGMAAGRLAAGGA